MSAAQLCVTGRLDQVRDILHAIRDGRPVRLSLVRDGVWLDTATVAVHVDAVVDDTVGRAA